jgi:hypothetical protein
MPLLFIILGGVLIYVTVSGKLFAVIDQIVSSKPNAA